MIQFTKVPTIADFGFRPNGFRSLGQAMAPPAPAPAAPAPAPAAPPAAPAPVVVVEQRPEVSTGSLLAAGAVILIAGIIALS